MGQADFWNLAGRAGRWGKEFAGNIVCIDPTDERLWPEAPTRKRPQRLSYATDTAARDIARLREYIQAQANSDASRKDPLAEAMFSFLASNYLTDASLRDFHGLDVSADQIAELEDLVASALNGIDVPPSLITKHAGVSPLGMQRLLDFFRAASDKESLTLAPPEDPNAATSYAYALGLLNDLVGGDFGRDRRQLQLAILITEWMLGRPLAYLIETRFRYTRAYEAPPPLARVIRETMADVEQIARFEAPRYLACYADLLDHHFVESGLPLALGVSAI